MHAGGATLSLTTYLTETARSSVSFFLLLARLLFFLDAFDTLDQSLCWPLVSEPCGLPCADVQERLLAEGGLKDSELSTWRRGYYMPAQADR